MVSSIEEPITYSVFTIESFNRRYRWDRWAKRLEGAFSISNITNEEVKKSHLFHYMGIEAYNILCDIIKSEEPASKTYAEIIDIMQEYYDPAPSEITGNFLFNQRTQQEQEGVQEFLSALQKLSINCRFNSYLEKALRNQFTFGLRNQVIQNRLLETNNLTLETAFKVAYGMELSAELLRNCIQTLQ